MYFTQPCSIKINLTLRVLGKRADGYHDLCSLFWRLRSPEVVEVSFGHFGDELAVSGADIKGENIITRACRHIRSVSGDELPGVRARLFKHLPAGSGVGAGSGNAAAFIRLCGAFAGHGNGPGAGVASLGADVAFLASEHDLAIASGVGDELEGIDGTLPMRAVIFFPEWSCCTKEAYGALDEIRGRESGYMPESTARNEALSVLDALRHGRRLGLLPNDFLDSAPHRGCYGELAGAASDSGAAAWGLCGSGSAFFALYGTSNECGKLLDKCRFDWLRQILVLE
ncbi:MAG: 4-diphosphocytidyl-2C-methyl-D-erythritol kinase [Synergistaceae bacterium]|jgi:4-diphosphocytidyl-2-C-methyl-D-erythritol kinase|nr:4-diphosphocytidyl-2C-methyl-D-erythritol kinase [Synergistaceae bacterium]